MLDKICTNAYQEDEYVVDGGNPSHRFLRDKEKVNPKRNPMVLSCGNGFD